MVNVSNIVSQLVGYGKLCFNVEDGWLKTWGSPPAYLLSTIPLVNNLFLRCKEEQLSHIFARAGLRQWLRALPQQQPADEAANHEPLSFLSRQAQELVELDKQFLESIERSRFIVIALNVTLIWLAFKACPFSLACVLSSSLITLFIDLYRKDLSIQQLILNSSLPSKRLSTEEEMKAFEFLIRGGVRLEDRDENRWPSEDVEFPNPILSGVNNKAVAQYLVEHGAGINKGDYHYHRKPLHYIRDPETIAYLIDQGAEVDVRDYYGFTPLLFLAMGKVEASQSDDSWLPDRVTAATRCLLTKGANVNAEVKKNYEPPKKGLTPLYLAVARGNVEMVKVLLEFGADPSITTEKGESPLSLSKKKRESGKPKAIQIANLLEQVP